MSGLERTYWLARQFAFSSRLSRLVKPLTSTPPGAISPGLIHLNGRDQWGDGQQYHRHKPDQTEHHAKLQELFHMAAEKPKDKAPVLYQVKRQYREEK